MGNRERRLLHHITLKVRNLERSKEFYRSIAETLGFTIDQEDIDRFFIDGLQVVENSEPTRCAHLAFTAPNPATVNLIHSTALKSGGTCLHPPESIGCDQNQFSALLQDPDGNNVEVVYRNVRSV